MGYLRKWNWKLTGRNMPAVMRGCPKCKVKRAYINTGKFRINANKRNVDVWMIWQCPVCRTTWNMTIYERVKPEELEPEEYQKFLANDEELIRQYTADIGIYRANRTDMDIQQGEYIVEKQLVEQREASENLEEITIQAEGAVDVRLDKLIGEQLGISRSQVRKWMADGRIWSDQCKNPGNVRIKRNFRFYVKK